VFVVNTRQFNISSLIARLLCKFGAQLVLLLILKGQEV
jgi:hypothetical protein